MVVGTFGDLGAAGCGRISGCSGGGIFFSGVSWGIWGKLMMDVSLESSLEYRNRIDTSQYMSIWLD